MRTFKDVKVGETVYLYSSRCGVSTDVINSIDIYGDRLIRIRLAQGYELIVMKDDSHTNVTDTINYDTALDCYLDKSELEKRIKKDIEFLTQSLIEMKSITNRANSLAESFKDIRKEDIMNAYVMGANEQRVIDIAEACECFRDVVIGTLGEGLANECVKNFKAILELKTT